MQDIDDYEKEYDRMEQENEHLADHQRSVLCDIRDEVDALDTLLQDTRLNRRRMQGAVHQSGAGDAPPGGWTDFRDQPSYDQPAGSVWYDLPVPSSGGIGTGHPGQIL